MENDKFYSYDEVEKLYPYKLPFYYDTLLCKRKSTFDKYNTLDDIVSIDETNTLFVNKQLIIDMIEENDMWSYFKSICDRDVNYACDITYIDNNVEEHIKLTKNQFAYALKQIIQERKMTDETRYALASYMLSVDFCYEYYSKEIKKYSCYIDGELKTISTKRLLDVLTCSNDKFYEFINKKSAYGLSIENIMYMLVDFVEKNNILTTYAFSPETFERYNSIKSYKYVDYESVNKFNSPTSLTSMKVGTGKTHFFIEHINDIFTNIKGKNVSGDLLTGKYSINPRMVNRVYQGMDSSYDALEKAIYIYIRLCDLLSFDETEALSDKEFIKEELDYDRIGKITPFKNKVVSSEFILIYAKLLKDLGIKFQPHIECTAGYENEYAYLSFKQAEYIVKVDLFNKNIIKNDLSKVKIGKSIDGIRCLNTNEVTKEKFKEKVVEIYSRYKKMFKKFNIIDEVVKEYTKDDYGLHTEEKIGLLYDYIKNSDLTGLDLINYIQTLVDSILNEDEHVDYKLYKYNNNNMDIYGLIICSDRYNYLVRLNDVISMTIISHEELDAMYHNKRITISDYVIPENKRRK
ncbi:MAG: hypothetical protein IKP76_01665 [Bacilli bacterium]|nr:hypothetical protein [Bacilli bacterium]